MTIEIVGVEESRGVFSPEGREKEAAPGGLGLFMAVLDNMLEAEADARREDRGGQAGEHGLRTGNDERRAGMAGVDQAEAYAARAPVRGRSAPEEERRLREEDYRQVMPPAVTTTGQDAVEERGPRRSEEASSSPEKAASESPEREPRAEAGRSDEAKETAPREEGEVCEEKDKGEGVGQAKAEEGQEESGEQIVLEGDEEDLEATADEATTKQEGEIARGDDSQPVEEQDAPVPGEEVTATREEADPEQEVELSEETDRVAVEEEEEVPVEPLTSESQPAEEEPGEVFHAAAVEEVADEEELSEVEQEAPWPTVAVSSEEESDRSSRGRVKQSSSKGEQELRVKEGEAAEAAGQKAVEGDSDAGREELTNQLLRMAAGGTEQPEAGSSPATVGSALASQTFAEVLTRVEQIETLVERFDLHVLSMLKTATDSLMITIQPEHMGRLVIHCSQDSEGVHVRVQAETAAVCNLLQEQLPAVRQVIEHNGFKLAGFQVNDQMDGQTEQEKGQQAQGREDEDKQQETGSGRSGASKHGVRSEAARPGARQYVSGKGVRLVA